MQIRIVLSLVAVLATACSSSSAPPGNSSASALTETSFDGTFAQYILSPHGDVDGIMLQDGTVARFPPHAYTGQANALAKGDKVHIEGEVTNGPSGRVVGHPLVKKGDVVLVARDAPPPSPGAPPPNGEPRPPGPREELALISGTGTIQSFSSDPRGNIDGVILSDGTVAHTGRKAHLDTLGLKVGDNVTVTGRGGAYPQGKALHIESIKLPNGETRTVERPRAELARATRSGTVTRVLLNPHGDVDGVVLGDAGVVHFRPQPGAKIAKGDKITVTGQGTAVFLEADEITLASGAVLGASGAPPAPPATPPAPLGTVEESGAIVEVLLNAEGDPDILVLADGALVRLPPEMADDGAADLKVGARVRVTGEGGTYNGTKTLHATRLAVGRRELTAAPGPGGGPEQGAPPPPPPPPAPPVAP